MPRFKFLSGLGLVLAGVAAVAASAKTEYEIPTVDDENLEIVLFASEPDIVTPTGAATAANGDLYVIESHTHSAPQDYPGPDGDIIKRFRDVDGDGRADDIHVFAEGIQEGMGLDFGPNGELYVITASDLIHLADPNGDEVSDASEWDVLLHLETRSGNPHGDGLGVAVDLDGQIYVSRGNVGGYPFEWQSKAGERIPGYGEGGDVVAIRPDGSGLRTVATGFWNPYVIEFDHHGRLLVADNDPDSVGPNRVVHIVEGGDYGFRSRYGPTGLHPFSGWDAELPGTLPILSGTGEAPSGLIDLTPWRLGPRYDGAFTATIWSEHHLSLHHPRPMGTSLTAEPTPWIVGGKEFRPVTLAPSLDGGFFITDWVLADYPNHLRGAIWLVRPKRELKRESWPERLPPDPGSRQLAAIAESSDFAALRGHLIDADPFIRHAAVMALVASATGADLAELCESSEPFHRQAAWLAWQRRGDPIPVARIRAALADSDEDVKILGLIHVGDAVNRGYTTLVDEMLMDPDISPRLFRFIMATLEILHSDVDERYVREERGFAIPREMPVELLERVVMNEALPPVIRSLAVPQLKAPFSDSIQDELRRVVATETDPSLLREAMLSLAEAPDPAHAALLLKRANDDSLPPALRADATAVYARSVGADTTALIKLASDPTADVRFEAARGLRTRRYEPAAQQALEALSRDSDPAVLELAQAVAQPASPPPASELEQWMDILGSGGSIAAGARVFQEPANMCVACHRIDNRGGRIGPDLSNIGATLSREQLITSTIQPSANVSPEYQGWVIHRKDGTDVIGLQLHLRWDGILIDGLDGVTFKTYYEDIESYETMDESLMPAGLEALLPQQDLLNLIAYMESLRL